MSINSVTTSIQSGITNAADNATTRNGSVYDTTQKVSAGEAAVYEKSDQIASTNATYTRDTTALSKISEQVETKLASLRATVENLFSMQGVKTGEAQGLSYDQIMEKYNGKLKEFYQSLEVDEATRLNAQQEISEDGFWGVKQTSTRAIEYAKALSGGDPSKIASLRNAIEEGYKAAEEAWGGELPEICKQTQEATLKGIDEWAKTANQT